MYKRIPRPKSVRFNVFKRDGFRCQYCGRAAPDVILHVDHIVPVAAGGGNDELNLITACQDCNLGKGKTQLSDMSAIDRQRKQLDDLNEMREQTEMLIQWKQELLQMDEAKVDAIVQAVFTSCHRKISKRGREDLKKYLKRFPFEDVLEAAEIAFSKYPKKDAMDKVGGICYNYSEAKSRRVQLLVQPSLWRDLEEKAEKSGISNNEAVNKAIRAYIYAKQGGKDAE